MAEIIWDSELGPSWPSDWPDTTIHAQFVAVTGDGADSNRLPDIAPSGNGEVIFTPSLRTVRYVGADGPYVVSLKQYRAVVDSEGYLCTPDTFGQPGERGIVLPSTDAEVIEPRGEDDNAFTWRVDFDIPAVNIRSDHIAVPVDGPYDLVDLLSPERAAGVVHIIDRVSARDAIQAAQEATAARDLVLPARDQTLAARDQTVAHGITVDTSVGTRVYVGDTMIYGDTGWRDFSHMLTANRLDINIEGGRFEVCRKGNLVSVNVKAKAGTDFIGTAYTLPFTVAGPFISGFRPSGGEVQEIVLIDGRGSSYVVMYFLSTSLMMGRGSSGTWAEGQTVEGQFSWLTRDPWPTSLPGSPA